MNCSLVRKPLIKHSQLLAVTAASHDLIVSLTVKFYGTSSKTQLMERDVQTSKTVSYCV